MFKRTHFIYIFLGVIGILGWNAWAIQRDAKLFRAYDYQRANDFVKRNKQKAQRDTNTDRENMKKEIKNELRQER